MKNLKINNEENYEHLCNVTLTKEKYPIAFQHKVDELVNDCGMTREEAEKTVREMSIEELKEMLKNEDARDILSVAEVFAEIKIIEFLKSKGGEYEFEEDELKPYLALVVDGIEEVSVEKLSLDENDNIIVFVKHTYPSDYDSVYSYNIYDFSTGQIVLLLDFLC